MKKIIVVIVLAMVLLAGCQKENVKDLLIISTLGAQGVAEAKAEAALQECKDEGITDPNMCQDYVKYNEYGGYCESLYVILTSEEPEQSCAAINVGFKIAIRELIDHGHSEYLITATTIKRMVKATICPEVE